MEKKRGHVYLSQNAESELIDYLAAKGCQIHLVEPNDIICGSEKYHPDLYMCKLGAWPEDEIFFGDKKRLTASYPGNVKYNGVMLGKYFIHKIAFTDSELLSEVRDRGAKTINVEQGYTKCNIVVVDDLHVITSDHGIAAALNKEAPGIQVLKISKGHVMLEGYPYGFLGGATGRVFGEMIFNGDITKHPDFIAIKSFVNSCGLDIKFFSYPLHDIGSIIFHQE